MNRFAVVVVTYRSDQVLPALLGGLEAHEPEAPVVVVDNRSPGGPPDAGGAARIVMSENRGYGAGCNAGVNHLRSDPPEFVAFLTPDIRLRAASITQLTERLLQNPSVGIATGAVVNERDERIPSAWGPTSVLRAFWFASGLDLRRLRQLAGRWLRGGVFTSSASLSSVESKVGGHVLGGAMVVRWQCLEDIVGFDEDFFLTWEDADLCQRARARGWEVMLLNCEPIVHLHRSSSEGVTERAWWDWYVSGARRFGANHLSPLRRRMLIGALICGRFVRTAFRPLRSATSRI
jgi:GT2 family glycosyltransferase